MATSKQSKLLYAAVARGTTVLAEHSNVSGNAPQIALRILEKLPQEDTRISYAQGAHMYHCLVTGGFAFLAMAEEAAGRRMPFAFLDDAAARFLERFGGGAGGSGAGATAAAYALNDEFAPILAQRMDFYASDAAADALARVRGEVEGVKGVMVENIARVLERGERLDLLVERTELLSGEALAFRRGAARARRVMWWQNVKAWFVMGGVAAGVVMVIVMAACGVTFNRCT